MPLKPDMGAKSASDHIRLIHWNATEGRQRAAQLREARYKVTYEPFSPSTLRRELRVQPPRLIVIDLSRLPSQGRDVAMAIRSRKALRDIPLIFVGGELEKVALIQRQLPDATYTNWSEAKATLETAASSPKPAFVPPRSALAGYAGVSLPKKLGIKAGSVVALIGAPPKFEDVLGDLPQGSRLRRDTRGPVDLTIWFVKSRHELERGIRDMAPLAARGRLWIAWPKQGSRLSIDLTQQVVRQIGLAAGLVDFKISAIDENWSGLRWTKRHSM